MTRQDLTRLLREALRGRRSKSSRREGFNWFTRNRLRLNLLFGDAQFRRYLFEPFIDVVESFDDTVEGRINATITQIALTNAAIANLPGKLGAGVIVSIGLEIWMATRIATHLGINIASIDQISRVLGRVAIVIAGTFFLFIHVIRFFFSVFSALPATLPAIALAELFATSCIGIFFRTALEQSWDGEKFHQRSLLKATPRVFRQAAELLKQQWDAIEHAFKRENLATMMQRFNVLLFGAPVKVDDACRAAQLFPVLAMDAYQEARFNQLSGPLGRLFQRIVESERECAAADVGGTGHFVSEGSPVRKQLTLEFVVLDRMFDELLAIYESGGHDTWAADSDKGEKRDKCDLVFCASNSAKAIYVFDLHLLDRITLEGSLVASRPHVTNNSKTDASPMCRSDPDLRMSKMTNFEDHALKEYVRRFVCEPPQCRGTNEILGVLKPVVLAFRRNLIDKRLFEEALEASNLDIERKLAVRLALTLQDKPKDIWNLMRRGMLALSSTVSESNQVSIRYRALHADHASV